MFLSIHKAYNDCFDNGQFSREKVVENKLIDLNYEYEFRMKLLENVFNTVLKSRIMNELAYEYLTNGHRTYLGCVDKWNKDNPDKAIKSMSGKNKIIYVARRINELYPDIEIDGKNYDVLQWLFETKFFMGISDSSDKQAYRSIFTKQFTMFNEACGEKIEIERKDMLLSIPTVEKVTDISDEEFDDLMEILRPYSRFVLNKVQDALNSMEKEVGYLRFLMSKTSKLTAIDIERKNDVLAWLGKEPISEYEFNVKDELEDSFEENEKVEEIIDDKPSEEKEKLNEEIVETIKSGEDNEEIANSESVEEPSSNSIDDTEHIKEILNNIIDELKSVDLSKYALGEYTIDQKDIFGIKSVYDSGYGTIRESIEKYFGDLEVELDTDDEDDDDN